MKNWKQDMLREQEEYELDMEREASFDNRGEPYADNGTGITARAHSIMNMTQDIHGVARKLSAVGLDKVADELTFLADAIHAKAKPISGIVAHELNASIAHGQHMMVGLLGVAMNMSEKDGKLNKLHEQIQANG